MQNMACTQPLQSRSDATRHEGTNFMVYRENERPRYESTTDNQNTEHAGVLHFVHGWIQQCQKAKVNYLIHSYLSFAIKTM